VTGRLTAPADPRSITDLLDDVRELRLTLAADLSTAAAAVDADSDEVAADILAGDRRDLAAFLRRSASRLEGLTPTSAPDADLAVAAPRPWRRRALVSLPAIPLVGALAMSAAAAAGLLPLPTQHHDHRARVIGDAAPVSTTFAEFETVLAGDPSASQVVAAATALHQQIAQMLDTARQNPGGVSEVARLLQLEQALLLRKQPPGSSLVLAQSRRLAARLLSVASQSQSTQPSPATVPTATASPHKSTTPKPVSTTSPKPSPTATTKTSSTPSPSPSSTSSSSTAPGHIPSLGG
jgi:hypothetical protein